MNFNKISRFYKLRYIIKTKRDYNTIQSNGTRFDILKHLCYKIKATGPITVAEYMKLVLTNPATGYYMHRDVFGESGDFITSPELGQAFGEMIGIWLINEWSKAGSPKPVQLIELGPGRGTLTQDILRVFKHFSLSDVSVALVEISPHLSNLQFKRLCLPAEIHDEKKDLCFYKKGYDSSGIPITWYKHIDYIPKAFTLLIAHEFFDALPIHKFQKTDKGYKEILIDCNESNLHYVLSSTETAVGKLFIRNNETRSHFEVSPESLVLTQKIASRIESDGGFALIADYGHDGLGTDTFRAFKQHVIHDPLIDPGTADLTADVDFAALKQVATQGYDVLTFGPISQGEFLRNMGIEHRIQKLKEKASKDQIKSLDYSFNMMTNSNKMGLRFKFLALVPSVLEKILTKYPPTGFHHLI